MVPYIEVTLRNDKGLDKSVAGLKVTIADELSIYLGIQPILHVFMPQLLVNINSSIFIRDLVMQNKHVDGLFVGQT